MTIDATRRPWQHWRSGAIRRMSGRDDEAYLLSSRKNAARLLEALEGARQGTGVPVDIDALRAEHGLGGR
jgi:hypothetical protein